MSLNANGWPTCLIDMPHMQVKSEKQLKWRREHAADIASGCVMHFAPPIEHGRLAQWCVCSDCPWTAGKYKILDIHLDEVKRNSSEVVDRILDFINQVGATPCLVHVHVASQ